MADVDDTEAKEAAIEIISSDLLLEIIRRVPQEDRTPQFEKASKQLISQASQYYRLIRLRLVSRHWNFLISNNFLLPKPFPAAGLIFQCGPTSEGTAADPFALFLDYSIFHKRKMNKPWHSGSTVVHSCNGLLLCAGGHRVYSVCNPTTGEHSALPKVPPPKNKKIRGASLVFDPCKSRHYKVVCVLRSEYDIRYFQFVVYSSETGCWGKCGKLFKTKKVSFGNSGVYWNGAIHWVGSSKLVCFNPDDRLPPKVMPMPLARNCRYYFGESYGHLHYIGLNDGVREVVVHEMSSDYSAGWVVKFKFDVSIALRRTFFYDDGAYDYNDFDVLAVVRGERSEDTFLVLGTSLTGQGKKIIRFNYDHTCQTKNNFNPEEHKHPFQYIESLASV